MKKDKAIFTLALLIFFLCACNLQKMGTPTGTNPDTVATIVFLTMAAFTQSAQQTPVASPTLEQSTNTPSVEITPNLTLTATLTPIVTLTPTMTPAMTQSLAPTNTPIPKPGTIAGSISGYPYGSLPSLAVVAFKQESATYWYVITNPGDTYYSMTDSSNKGLVTPGSYQVVAYDGSGNTGGCTTIVTVTSDQTVTCDITDWSGGYPAKPSGVPNP